MKLGIGKLSLDHEHPGKWIFSCDRPCRFWIDGNGPTATKGHYLSAGESLILNVPLAIESFRVILAKPAN